MQEGCAYATLRKGTNLIEAIQIMQNEAGCRHIPGPAYSLVNMAAILGVQIRCEQGTILYVPENGPPLDFVQTLVYIISRFINRRFTSHGV